MELEPTGERMIVDEYQGNPEDRLIYHLHVETYLFAEQFTPGKRVLDYGCGSGYGSAMIARSAADVTGVDVALDAVSYANERYAGENLRFVQIDPDARLPFEDRQFDVVLSFQVFEHVEDEQRYLREVARVLVPGGVLLLVTPDRSTRLLPLQQPWNRWHLREYSASSLTRQLSRVFTDIRMLGMTGPPGIVGVELKRCRRLKWLSLPFTLPFYPRPLRIALLNMVHRLRGRGTGPGTGSMRPLEPIPQGSICIEAGATPSLNLVAVVHKAAD